jgi:hypothetical protein
MHHALFLDDIVPAIVGRLDPDHDRAALAALASTCHVFSDPALESLWRDPPVYYLAQQMSKDLWTNVQITSVDSPQHVPTSVSNLFRMQILLFRFARY